MSLCKFVHVHDSESMKSDENTERSPKTAPFEHQGHTRITGKRCLVIIIIILCKSMYIIIYIYAKFSVITLSRQSLCYPNPDISGGRNIV